MAPYLGFGSSFGVGEESTWGTAVSRTKWYRLISSTLRREVSKTARDALHEGAGLVSRRHFIGQDNVSGTVVIECGYEGMGMLLKHALWTTATTGPVSGVYTHTYTLGSSAPTGGLTCEVIQGTGSAIVYEGVRISRIKWTCEAGGRFRVEMELIGETSGAPTSAGSPSYTTNEIEVEHHHVGTLDWASTQFALRSYSVELDNKLERRQVLGSKFTTDPKPSAPRTITISISADYENNEFQTGMTADTQSDAVLAAAFGTDHSIEWTVHNAYVATDEVGVNVHGYLPEAVTLMGESDATDKGMAIVITNTQSTATA